MQFITVKTRAMLAPKDDLYAVLEESLPVLHEGDILFVTSKVVSIHQGRCIPNDGTIKKDDLVRQEAEAYIPREKIPANRVILTIAKNTLIPSAGIDESNANGYFILWTERINEFAKELTEYLKRKYHLTKLAVIITDSHSIPLRSGVVGVSIGFFGLKPLYDYRGKNDIFGKTLGMTQVNIPDALSSMAVFLMGEGDEQLPMVIARGVQRVVFTEEDTYGELIIPRHEDMFCPLLDIFHKESAE